jgi:hypothetical protein
LFEGNALNAGNYALLYSNQLGYDFATASSITISPAPLTVTAIDFSKFYDGTTYSGGNGVGYSDFVNGKTSAVLGGSLVYGGNSQGAVSPGLYGITISGLSSSNYNLTYVDGTLQIEPRTLAEATPGYTDAVNSGSYYNSGQTSAFNNPQYGSINACAPSDAYVRL